MKCNGCGACSIICPTKCINIEYDSDGFLSQVINTSACINCGLCKKICPINSSNTVPLDKLELYSAWSHENRELSSSGGIAAVLSEYAINQGYEVCGAVLDYNTLNVKHKLFEKKDSLNSLRGSKYLQSNTAKAFQEIINLLRNFPQKKIMVFGTPCQISGLRNVIEFYGWTDRVVFIDIFCHGVPSNLLWVKYIEYIRKKMKLNSIKDIKNIQFRDKSYSWHEYFMNINSGEYIESRDKDPFLKLFTMGILNQETCFTCKFRNYTVADIRLGDYWGKRFKNNEDGVSMVLTNGSKGLELLNSISDKIYMEKQDLSERFAQQHTDYNCPKYYKKSFELLKDSTSELQDIINLYESNLDRLKKNTKKILKNLLNYK